MSDLENSRARVEAVKATESRALRSARRSQLWAGLNRYLESEARHATKVAATEQAERAEHTEHTESAGQTGQSGQTGQKGQTGEDGTERAVTPPRQRSAEDDR